MDSKFLKEYAEKMGDRIKKIKASEAELKGPMSQEDYDFERACEMIFHM